MGLFGKKDKEKEIDSAPPRPAPRPAEARPEATAAPAPAQSAPQPALDPEQAKKASAESQQALLAFGQVVTVLMNAPQIQKMSLETIKALVVPAIMTNQYVVAIAQSAQTGHVTPVGAALWASVSDEVDQRLSTDLDGSFSISMNEWQSGPHLWLILSAGDGRAVNAMLTNVQKTTMQGRPLKVRMAGEDGKTTVRTFSSEAA